MLFTFCRATVALEPQFFFEQNMAIFLAHCASEQRRTRLVLDFHIGTPTFTQGKQVLHGHHHTPIMTLELPVSLTLAIRPRTV